MKRNISISYEWHSNQFPDGIPESLQETLEESAEDRIFEMTRDGFTEGELLDNINTDIEGMDTPEDGWEFRGSFTINKEKVDPEEPEFAGEYRLTPVVDFNQGKWAGSVFFTPAGESKKATHVCYLGREHESEQTAMQECKEFCFSPLADLRNARWFRG